MGVCNQLCAWLDAGDADLCGPAPERPDVARLGAVVRAFAFACDEAKLSSLEEGVQLMRRAISASLGALQNFGGYLGGALAPMATGFIVQASGSFVPAMLLGAGIALASAVGYFVIIQGPIPAAAAEGHPMALPAE